MYDTVIKHFLPAVGILVSPESQAVPLGTNATFFCSGRGSTTNWIINITVVGFSNRATFIERGFVFQKERVHTSGDDTQNINNLTMTVLATIENNNTMIKCLSSADGTVTSDVVNLTVIGKLNMSMLISCYCPSRHKTLQLITIYIQSIQYVSKLVYTPV